LATPSRTIAIATIRPADDLGGERTLSPQTLILSGSLKKVPPPSRSACDDGLQVAQHELVTTIQAATAAKPAASIVSACGFCGP
jgi:hypothetical protein